MKSEISADSIASGKIGKEITLDFFKSFFIFILFSVCLKMHCIFIIMCLSVPTLELHRNSEDFLNYFLECF